MSKTISLTVTDEQMELIELAAATKGLSRSQFAKMTLFAHINQHPPKGAMAHLAPYRSSGRRSDGSQVNSEGLTK